MENHVIVNTLHGQLRGKKTLTKSGGPLITFQGIPYASPPVGPLRFKPPLSLEPWTGIRDALQEGPASIQFDLFTNTFQGKEDCLYLNVYIPKVKISKSDNLPVMAWVHGGGFTVFNGGTDLFGGDYLVDMGVIVVSFNYRLGPLGFLSLGDEHVPGNMGLKDQVAALKWIQENIANFGGDPKNVTLFGESAGGASVHYHMLSPMSRGLFSKAILQSGSAFNHWAFTRKSRERAFRLGEALGFKTDDSLVLLDSLMSANAEDLITAARKNTTKEEQLTGNIFPFVPTIEPKIVGEEGFLTDEPIAVMREGRFHQVPLIAGVNTHEGMMFLKSILPDPTVLSVIDGDFQMMIPDDLREKKSIQQLQDLAKKIKKFYFDDKPVSIDTLTNFDYLEGDIHFVKGVEKMVNLQATLSSSPIFYYQFTFDGNMGMIKKMLEFEDMPGACHGDELGYLFHSDLLNLIAEPNSPEEKVQKKMVKLWTNFAKTGNPTPELDVDINVKWIPYSISKPSHMRIDTQLSLGQEIEKKRMDFWKELYQSNL